MAEADVTQQVDEFPEEVDAKSHHRHAWECGWCNDYVSALTRVGVHLKLLWHQWMNHRDRIWGEY